VQVGKYFTTEMIGHGGFGSVHKATEFKEVNKNGSRTLDLNQPVRIVALKLVRLNTTSLDQVEAEKTGAGIQEKLSQVDSCGIARIFQYGNIDDYFYIAMEYVEGEDLSKILEREKILDPSRIARIGINICTTLKKAHSLNVSIEGKAISSVIHGDIAAKNIRIDKNDQPILLDFGIAKALSLTRILTQNDFATTEYCSPERLDSGAVDIQSDLWSIGVLLYEMAAGKKPFIAKNREVLEKLIRARKLPPPLPNGCHKILQNIIFKALDPDINKRYKSAAEIIQDLMPLNQDDELTRRVIPPNNSASTPNNNPKIKQGTITSTSSQNNSLTRAIFVGSFSIIIILIGISFYSFIISPHWEVSNIKNKLTPFKVSCASDLEDFWKEYKRLAEKNSLGIGMSSLKSVLASKLVEKADCIINDSVRPKPTIKTEDLKQASTALERALELDPTDSTKKAKKHYCDGDIARRVAMGNLSSGKKKEAKTNFEKAIKEFEESIRLLNWALPHLGLADTYTYTSPPDPNRVFQELDIAKQLGLNINEREIAIKADVKRLYGSKLNIKGASLLDKQDALNSYKEALELYKQIPDFGDSRDYINKLEKTILILQAKIDQESYENN